MCKQVNLTVCPGCVLCVSLCVRVCCCFSLCVMCAQCVQERTDGQTELTVKKEIITSSTTWVYHPRNTGGQKERESRARPSSVTKRIILTLVHLLVTRLHPPSEPESSTTSTGLYVTIVEFVCVCRVLNSSWFNWKTISRDSLLSRHVWVKVRSAYNLPGY